MHKLHSYFSLSFFCIKAREEEEEDEAQAPHRQKAGDNKAPGTERQHRKREVEGVYARPRDAAALVGFRREESGFGRRRS